MRIQRLFSIALLLAAPTCEALETSNSTADELCPTPTEGTTERLASWLAGGLMLGVGALTSIRLGVPVVESVAAAEPQGGAPLEVRDAVGSICVWADAQPRVIEVRIPPAGDTLAAAESGGWVALRALYPLEPTASAAPWFVEGSTIRYAGRSYVPYGSTVQEDGLHRIGEYRGVPVLSRMTINAAPSNIYLPLDGCVYQPYRVQAELQPRG